jgi:hypothetical protein
MIALGAIGLRHGAGEFFTQTASGGLFLNDEVRQVDLVEGAPRRCGPHHWARRERDRGRQEGRGGECRGTAGASPPVLAGVEVMR